MEDGNTHEPNPSASEQAEEILRDGSNIRQRLRDLIISAYKRGQKPLGDLSAIANQTLDGAVEGMKQVAEDQRTGRAREVFLAVMDSFAIAANATRLAAEEAGARGRTYVEQDLQKAVNDLGSLEQDFFKVVSGTASSGANTVAAEFNDLVAHARRTGTSIQPAVTRALTALRDNPAGVATDAAAAGVGLARDTASTLLHGIAGFLDNAAEALKSAGDKVEPKGDAVPPTQPEAPAGEPSAAPGENDPGWAGE